MEGERLGLFQFIHSTVLGYVVFPIIPQQNLRLKSRAEGKRHFTLPHFKFLELPAFRVSPTTIKLHHNF